MNIGGIIGGASGGIGGLIGGGGLGGILGGAGQDSGGLLSSIGGIVGGIFGGPIGSMIGQLAGQILGKVLDEGMQENGNFSTQMQEAVHAQMGTSSQPDQSLDDLLDQAAKLLSPFEFSRLSRDIETLKAEVNVSLNLFAQANS